MPEQMNLSTALDEINAIKNNLGTALNGKGMTVTEEFSSFPTAVSNLSQRMLQFPRVSNPTFLLTPYLNYKLNEIAYVDENTNRTARYNDIWQNNGGILSAFSTLYRDELTLTQLNEPANPITGLQYNTDAGRVIPMGSSPNLWTAIQIIGDEEGYVQYRLTDTKANQDYIITVVVGDINTDAEIVSTTWGATVNGDFTPLNEIKLEPGNTYWLGVQGDISINSIGSVNQDTSKYTTDKIYQPIGLDIVWQLTDLYGFNDVDSVTITSSDTAVATVTPYIDGQGTQSGWDLNCLSAGTTTLTLNWLDSNGDAIYSDLYEITVTQPGPSFENPADGSTVTGEYDPNTSEYTEQISVIDGEGNYYSLDDVAMNTTVTDPDNRCSIGYVDDGEGTITSVYVTIQEGTGQATLEFTDPNTNATCTSTFDYDISAPAQPTSISFDQNSYSISAVEGDSAPAGSFIITDDLGNDVTENCGITFSPNDTGLYTSGFEFYTEQMSAGTYSVDVTADYNGLTATASVDVDISAPAQPTSISFDQNSYSISNVEGISASAGSFTITDDLGNDVTESCTITFSPNDTGLYTSGYDFYTEQMSAGTYSVDVTADYNGLTATATVDIDIAVNTPNYMKLSVLNNSGNDGNITITIPASVDSTKATSLSYSTDGTNWTDTTIDNTDQTIVIPVSAGDEVYLKGIADTWASFYKSESCTNISSTVDFNASGNIMSLLYGDNHNHQTSFPGNRNYIFCRLFENNTHLIYADSLELPATELVNYCYENMFVGCTSLTSSPELPATELVSGCYREMFAGCASLTLSPELPATTLANGCYYGMFNGCTSLTLSPELPATTLAKSCYENMFAGCSSLNSITMLAEDISATYCLTDWVQNVAATGTFTKSGNQTSLPTGIDGIPSGWTVVDYVPQ